MNYGLYRAKMISKSSGFFFIDEDAVNESGVIVFEDVEDEVYDRLLNTQEIDEIEIKIEKITEIGQLEKPADREAFPWFVDSHEYVHDLTVEKFLNQENQRKQEEAKEKAELTAMLHSFARKMWEKRVPIAAYGEREVDKIIESFVSEKLGK